MMTCDRARELLGECLLGEVDGGELASLRSHLRDCTSCRAAGPDLREAVDSLALTVELVQPPTALRSRLLATVHAEAARSEIASQRRRAPWSHRLWDRVPSGRMATLAGGLTGAAGAAAAIVLALHHGSAPTATPPQATVVTSCELVGNPRTCGTLTYDPVSHTGVLSVTGLEPLTEVGGVATGSYEVWLVRADHTAVAASFLTPTPDHSAYTAPIQGDLASVVSVDTTREPAAGSRYPTGPDVLHLQLGAPAPPS